MAVAMTMAADFLQIRIPPLDPTARPRFFCVGATRRRSAIILTTASPFLLSSTKPSEAFEFTMTVPDQTLEEAESAIQGHAQSLVKVKDLLTAESWREAQKLLRKSSALLKQDMYTIIQEKPAAERPLLRKLYAELFNGVSRLDFAARDKDKIAVWECYDRILVSLNNILSRLL